MVVDDNESIRFLLRKLAARTDGCEVVGEADNGADAARIASDLQPDAVVLDVHMPKVDGVQAIPLIRQASPGTRIVVFSSDPTRHDEALAAGAHQWCDKSDGFTAVLERAIAEATGARD